MLKVIFLHLFVSLTQSAEVACGRRNPSNCNLGRVIGGVRACSGTRPWMVQVVLDNNTVAPNLCGGSLISDRVVALAAHCTRLDGISIDPKRLFILLAGDAPQHKTYRTLRTFPVSEVHRHPDYQVIKGQYDTSDVAVLILKEPLPSNIYGKIASPICLPADDAPIPDPYYLLTIETQVGTCEIPSGTSWPTEKNALYQKESLHRYHQQSSVDCDIDIYGSANFFTDNICSNNIGIRSSKLSTLNSISEFNEKLKRFSSYKILSNIMNLNRKTFKDIQPVITTFFDFIDYYRGNGSSLIKEDLFPSEQNTKNLKIKKSDLVGFQNDLKLSSIFFKPRDVDGFEIYESISFIEIEAGIQPTKKYFMVREIENKINNEISFINHNKKENKIDFNSELKRVDDYRKLKNKTKKSIKHHKNKKPYLGKFDDIIQNVLNIESKSDMASRENKQKKAISKLLKKKDMNSIESWRKNINLLMKNYRMNVKAKKPYQDRIEIIFSELTSLCPEQNVLIKDDPYYINDCNLLCRNTSIDNTNLQHSYATQCYKGLQIAYGGYELFAEENKKTQMKIAKKYKVYKNETDENGNPKFPEWINKMSQHKNHDSSTSKKKDLKIKSERRLTLIDSKNDISDTPNSNLNTSKSLSSDNSIFKKSKNDELNMSNSINENKDSSCKNNMQTVIIGLTSSSTSSIDTSIRCGDQTTSSYTVYNNKEKQTYSLKNNIQHIYQIFPAYTTATLRELSPENTEQTNETIKENPLINIKQTIIRKVGNTWIKYVSHGSNQKKNSYSMGPRLDYSVLYHKISKITLNKLRRSLRNPYAEDRFNKSITAFSIDGKEVNAFIEKNNNAARFNIKDGQVKIINNANNEILSSYNISAPDQKSTVSNKITDQLLDSSTISKEENNKLFVSNSDLFTKVTKSRNAVYTIIKCGSLMARLVLRNQILNVRLYENNIFKNRAIFKNILSSDVKTNVSMKDDLIVLQVDAYNIRLNLIKKLNRTVRNAYIKDELVYSAYSGLKDILDKNEPESPASNIIKKKNQVERILLAEDNHFNFKSLWNRRNGFSFKSLLNRQPNYSLKSLWDRKPLMNDKYHYTNDKPEQKKDELVENDNNKNQNTESNKHPASEDAKESCISSDVRDSDYYFATKSSTKIKKGKKNIVITHGPISVSATSEEGKIKVLVSKNKERLFTSIKQSNSPTELDLTNSTTYFKGSYTVNSKLDDLFLSSVTQGGSTKITVMNRGVVLGYAVSRDEDPIVKKKPLKIQDKLGVIKFT